MLVFSKCIAGGVSAALVLIWWPRLAPGASLSAWLGRGVAFTLAFELLLLALRPLEQTLWGTQSGSRLRGRIDVLAQRLRRGDTVRQLSSSAVIAAAALAVPGLLIAAGLAQRPANHGLKPERAVRIVHVTKVVRPVTVRQVVAPAAASAAPARGEATTNFASTDRTPATRSTAPKTSGKVKTRAREPAAGRGSQPAGGDTGTPKTQTPDQGTSTKDATGSRTASGASLDRV